MLPRSSVSTGAWELNVEVQVGIRAVQEQVRMEGMRVAFVRWAWYLGIVCGG
jgi:hypothetical protein